MSLLRYQAVKEPDELDKHSNLKKTLIRQTQSLDSYELEYSSYLCTYRSFNHLYEHNLNNSYWLVIETWIKETKAKENYNNFIEKYCNDPRIRGSKIPNILSQLRGEVINSKSFVNFIRHFPVLDQYISARNYHISVLNNSIRLHIWHRKTNLVLQFNSDFLIDFYSYDKDDKDYRDHLVYSMKGSFSSSSSLRKSYKIERLLALFDKELVAGNQNVWGGYNPNFVSVSSELKTIKKTICSKSKSNLVD